MKRITGMNHTRGMTVSSAVLFFLLTMVQAVFAAPLVVRVQPSGDTFANAYVVTGEQRSYFGNVEGGTAPYAYKWEFSNGGDTGFASVGNPRYIAVDNKAFDTAGTHWARLTVSDSSATPLQSSATVNLQVIAAGSDNLARQKNSAIDRGLRFIYNQESVSGSGSSWPGSGAPFGSTGMALIALENHGHNLQSPDSDIYKKSVQEGVRFLLNNAAKIDIASQQCIGDPEANDGDSDHDGKGVRIGGDDMYTANIAVLALVNSCDKATAQATVASTTSGDVNGMTLWDIVVDAKDYIAFAQGDQSSGSSSINFSSAQYAAYFYATISGLNLTGLTGYFDSPDLGSLACGGTYTINWGDLTSDTFTAGSAYCPWGYNQGYPDIGYGSPTRSHTYAAGGTYTVSISYDDGVHAATSIATAVVTATGDGAACNDAGANGGWRYGSNFYDSDNSVTQWPVLALSEARNRWDINVNPKVVSRLNDWLVYSQCSNGAFGYTSGDSSGWCNFPKGAAGTIMLKYGGKLLTDAPVQNALNFLNTNWGSENLGNLYGMYAFYKAMKSWDLKVDNGGRDWNQVYSEYLVGSQQASNAWYDNGWEDTNFASYSALAIMAPEVASLPPVADAGGPYADAAPLQAISLDGSKSYHRDPAKNIVKWQWDFDASNGLWWDTKGAPDAGEGAVGITAVASYPKAGSDKIYTVTLRVTDNNAPAIVRDNSATIKVIGGNVSPVAVTNGPWSSTPGAELLFDGSASNDPNSCTTLGDPSCLGDSIVMYEWDLNGDGIYNNADGSDGAPVIPGDYRKVKKIFTNPISLPATLRVTDSLGKSGISSAQYNIISVSLLYARAYETCYKVTIDRTRERQGIRLKFKNLGNSAASNVTMTATQLPSNLTFSNNKSFTNLGGLAPNEEKYSACNPTAKTADIEVIFNRTIVPSGDWRWRSTFDMGGNHYQVDNIPPLY